MARDDWEDVPIQKKQVDDFEDIPIRSKAAPVQEGDFVDRLASEYLIPGIKSVGRGALETAGAVGQAMDKYGGGAALRAGIGKVIQGEPSSALRAAYEQYGEDPTKAPSGKELASQLGVSEKEYAIPFIVNPFAKGTAGQLKVSPAGIVGGAGEMAADPTNIIPFGKVGQGVAFATRKGLVAPIAKTGEIVTPYLGKLAFRVPTETTRAFMEDPSRIKAAAAMYTSEDLKDIIDQTVGTAKKDVENLTEQRNLMRESLKQKLRDKRFDLLKRDPNTEVVFKIQAQLEAAKGKLRQMSEVADEYLAKTKIKIPKRNVLALANQISKDFGGVKVGMGRRDALRKWQDYVNELIDEPGVLDGPRMREIMRQIRSDKNWQTDAGEFSPDLDLMRTAFTENLSNLLKKFSPEYKQMMEAMHERSQNLEYLTGRFGRKNDPTVGTNTLKSLQEAKAPGTDYLRQQLKKHAAYMQDETLPQLLEKWEEGNRTLERLRRGEDLGPELFPEDVKALQETESAKAMAEDIYNPMARMGLGTDKAQSVIRRYNYPTASIEDRRALEAIGQAAGIDLPQIIKDKAIYEGFEKDATAGSRMTALGAVTGGVPGAIAGFIGDRFGGQMLRGSVSGGVALKNAIDDVLLKIQNDPTFLAKFGARLGKAARKGGKSLLLYHRLMMNNDPEYRQYFAEGQ